MRQKTPLGAAAEVWDPFSLPTPSVLPPGSWGVFGLLRTSVAVFACSATGLRSGFLYFWVVAREEEEAVDRKGREPACTSRGEKPSRLCQVGKRGSSSILACVCRNIEQAQRAETTNDTLVPWWGKRGYTPACFFS